MGSTVLLLCVVHSKNAAVGSTHARIAIEAFKLYEKRLHA